MGKTYNITQASEIIGVSVKTLQRWDREGKLVASRTPSNRRYYTREQLINDVWKCVDFNTNEILELIKNRYKNLEERNMTMGDRNIAGHIVYEYWQAQKDDNKFFANFDMDMIDNNWVSLCMIDVKKKTDLLIMSVGFDITEDIRVKWLYQYMKKIDADRGIVISGYNWNMVDVDGTEYSLDFRKDITSDEFGKFLI